MAFARSRLAASSVALTALALAAAPSAAPATRTYESGELETRTAGAGGVRAELSFREIDFRVSDLRLRIRRHGKLVLDRAPRGGCHDCGRALSSDRPLRVSDLEGDDEPEVLLDLYSGGAHCCSYTLLYRYARDGSYRRSMHWWGNVGYRLTHLNRDRRAELVSRDDRFAYAFTAYAFSFEPAQIWSLRAGVLRDVTRKHPDFVRRHARTLWRTYARLRERRDSELRGVLAAYLADTLLVGEGRDGWRRLGQALDRGDLGRDDANDGWPSGKRYLRALRGFLVSAGYVSAKEAARILPL